MTNVCAYCEKKWECEDYGEPDMWCELAYNVKGFCNDDCGKCPNYDDCIRDEKITGFDRLDPVEIIKDDEDIKYVSFTTIHGVHKVAYYYENDDGVKEQYIFHNPDNDEDKEWNLTIESWEKGRIKELLDVDWKSHLFDCVYYPIRGR